MTTLVTGSGFIGSHIVKTLVEEGETPILYSRSPKIEYISDIVDIKKLKLIKGDILDFNQLQEIVKKEEVDNTLLSAVIQKNKLIRINIE